MDVTPDADELAELRARAYGPDADIHGDPAARARLHELEESRRAAAVPRSVVAQAFEPSIELGTEHAFEPATSHSFDRPLEPTPEDTVPVGHEGDGSEAPVQPKRRRMPLWAYIVAGSLLVSAVVVIAAFLPGRPDATLHLVSDSEAIDIEPTGMLDFYQIDPDAMHRYDDFAGIQVWSGLSRSRSQCLVLIYFGNVANASCAPTNLDPIVDFVVYDGARAVGRLGLPVGSVIRFHQRGDTIDVTVGRAAPQEAAPFEDPFSGSDP